MLSLEETLCLWWLQSALGTCLASQVCCLGSSADCLSWCPEHPQSLGSLIFLSTPTHLSRHFWDLDILLLSHVLPYLYQNHFGFMWFWKEIMLISVNSRVIPSFAINAISPVSMYWEASVSVYISSHSLSSSSLRSQNSSSSCVKPWVWWFWDWAVRLLEFVFLPIYLQLDGYFRS